MNFVKFFLIEIIVILILVIVMTKLSDTLTNVPGEIPPIQTPHSHVI